MSTPHTVSVGTPDPTKAKATWRFFVYSAIGIFAFDQLLEES